MDCGTNSIRLLVRDGDARLVERATVTRLGRGVHVTRKLADESLQKTYEVLDEYRSEVDSLGAVLVKAVATSAVRDAVNGDAFMAEASKRLGVTVETITGDAEARLTFCGALGGNNMAGPWTVIDIGGGSTEIALGDSNQIQNAHSFDVGSVRLTEMFLPDDPPTFAQLQVLSAYVHGLIDRHEVVVASKSVGAKVCAVGGTATSLSAIAMGFDRFDFDQVNGSQLERSTVAELVDRFMKMTSLERSEATGLDPGRADVIVAGAAILLATMTALDARELRVSAMDLLDGLVSA